MIDAAPESETLSHFQQNTTEWLGRLKATGEPVVLTCDGKEELVVQDAAAYRRMAELAERRDDGVLKEELRGRRSEQDAAGQGIHRGLRFGSMKFRVEFAEMAANEVARAYRWLKDRSPQAAERWRLSLLDAIASLSARTERCALAPEKDWFPGEIRQTLHGKRFNVYRVLFVIRGQVVHILRVRHRVQDLLGSDDLGEDAATDDN